ncbi:hypothetical protein HDU89_006844 [Geranomyces variabilis]|nr:hypothetical protein HDU89_006844 [Geranomyces variabilis]
MALTIRYDEHMAYSDERPDVQVLFGTRVAACSEIKSMLTLINKPVRLAMWSPSKDRYAYEVIRYWGGLAIVVGQVVHAIGWFSAVAARIDHIKRRMEADVPLDM